MAEESVPKWLVEKINHAETSIALNRPTIYRVPESLRELNKEAYIPQVISIGPLHHGSLKLKSMEKYKLRLFRSFMERTNTNKEELASIIQDSEESVRECYAEAITFDHPDTFKQIILVDAGFLIEFSLMSWIDEEIEGRERFAELTPWQFRQIILDLTLLENQLPFFIIEKLYDLLPELGLEYPDTFLELILKTHFSEENFQKMLHDGIDSDEVMHFLDLIRYSFLCPRESLPKRSFKAVKKMYCASQLAEAGLKFEPTSSRSIVNLKFNEGVLQIPTFTLDKEMETSALNLVALEQCCYPFEGHVTDYFIMLDFLINTGKDVDFLIDKEIIKKADLGANIIPTLAGNFCPGISLREVNDDYYDLCTKLVEFRKKIGM